MCSCNANCNNVWLQPDPVRLLHKNIITMFWLWGNHTKPAESYRIHGCECPRCEFSSHSKLFLKFLSWLLLRLESILFTFNEIRPTFVIGLSVFCCMVRCGGRQERIEMLSIFKAMSLFTFVSHLRTRRREKKSPYFPCESVIYVCVRHFTCAGKCIVK